MARGDPKSPAQERFGDLSPDEFEMLVFRLAWIDNRQVARLVAPDGGLDTVLSDPARPGKALTGWQAKRHTRRIDWEDCERSLDRAASVWAPTTVTFVFPRDLKAHEHQTFARRLGNRHAGVHVDYWGASHLVAMFASRDGRRVRGDYFEEDDAATIAERMLRAGNSLRTGADFVEAEQSVSEATVAAAGPDYDWIVHKAPPGTAEPAPTDAAMLRLSFGGEAGMLYVDLVPRNRSPAKVPGLTITVDDSAEGRQARQWLEGLMTGGGRLSLREGVEVKIRDLPAPFGALVGEQPHGVLNLRAVPVAAPFYARLTADPQGEPVPLDVDLLPQEAPPDWDAVLAGRVGGLNVSLAFRWLVHESRGESRLNFRYQDAGAPHAGEAIALRWVIAVAHSGRIGLSDRVGARPAVVQQGEPHGVESWMQTWAALHENLATLEQASGRPMPPVPSHVTSDQFAAIAQVARVLRSRQMPVTVHDASITIDRAAAAKVGSVLTDVRIEAAAVAVVFGEEVPVARQVMELPPMLVRDLIAAPGGWEIRMVPLGSAEAHVLAELVPLTEWTTDTP